MVWCGYKWGSWGMINLITGVVLTNSMAFGWKLIKAGERVVALAERWGADDQEAGLAEVSVRKAGTLMTVGGERLELAVNGFAVWCGYADGEVSGMVAWPA